MENQRKHVTLLVPCYNEEQTLPLFYKEVCTIIDPLENYCWDLLFVNDGSQDQTVQILELMQKGDDRVSFLSLSRNFGKEAAMLAGFDQVHSDAAIIMDADLQDPPSLIPKMLHYWDEGYDDVYCKRTRRGKESWFRKTVSLFYYSFLQHLAQIDIPQNVGDFRLLDKKCIDAIKQLRETERYTKGLFAWIGYNKKELLFERGNRKKGQSSWSFHALFDLAIKGITSFSTTPLRLSTILGFFISIVAFVYMCFVFVKALIWGNPVAGYPSLIIIILFLGGVQLVSLGILGEYLGKVFNETKRRPPYLIDRYEKGKGMLD